jgi:processing peptidase subunit beta
VSRLKGQLLMQLDGTFPIAEDQGRQLLTLGRRMTPAELFLRLDAIDAKAVREVAYEYLNNCELAVAAMGPIAVSLMLFVCLLLFCMFC